MNKRIFGALFGVFVLALLITAAPVLADEVTVEAENKTTGQDSNNRNTHTVNNSGDVTVTNDADDIDNTATGTANTGGNSQSRNTEGGDIDSGSVDASTDWETAVNNGAALAGAGAGGDLDVKGDFENDTTGQSSENHNTLTVTDSGNLTLTNDADDIDNILRFLGVTGENSQDRNTTAGTIDTGDVDVDSDIMNEANNDSGLAAAASSSVDVNVDGRNGTTGQDSNNRNTFTVRNSGDVSVTNDADITNTTVVTGNTGNNSQSRNTTAGDIKTGKVEASTDIQNSVNNGSSLSGAGAGDLDVNGDFENDTTGQGSENHNTLSVVNDGDVTVNNDADVQNTAVLNGDTGNNTQDRNTTGGDIDTGGVSFEFNTSTEANNN